MSEAPPGPGRLQSMPPRRREVSGVESLRQIVPAEYQKWVRTAVLASTLGYGAMVFAVVVYQPTELLRMTQFYGLLSGLSGLLLLRFGKYLLATCLVIGAASLEVLAGFYSSPDGMRSFSLMSQPLLALATGMFLGSRAAYVFASISSVAVPLVVYVGGLTGAGPGLKHEDGLPIVALALTVFVTAVLFDMFGRSFSSLLSRAREEARRAATEVIDSAPDGMLVISPRGTIDSANELAARFLGMKLDELWGERPEDLPICPLDNPDGVLEIEALSGAEEARVFLSPNVQIGLEVRVRPISGGHAASSWLVLLRDITERLKADHRERELEIQLRHSQKLEAVGQLAGGVAHDFNNLLTVVAGYADFIGDMKERGAPEVAAQLRATYQRGVHLTRQLLAFARKDVVRLRPIDLSDLVLGLEKLLHRVVGEVVRVELSAPQIAPIVADRGQMEQVVVNLAANARDAMPSGGTFRISVRVVDDRVVLKASDTGSGMDPEVQERIFDPFFTTKPRGKGTGLGLSTVHGIVTQSGGTISVDSVRGEGTTFTLTWPVTSERIRKSSIPEPRSAFPRGEGLILLAEDDPQTRKFLRRTLTDAGFEVLEAQNGAEALSIAVNLDKAPDLVLTDVVMPGMSGVELVERVRLQYPHVPFLFVSGYTDDELDGGKFDLGADLLMKPFGRDVLLDRVLRKCGRTMS